MLQLHTSHGRLSSCPLKTSKYSLLDAHKHNVRNNKAFGPSHAGDRHRHYALAVAAASESDSDTKVIPGTVKDYGSCSKQGLRETMEDDMHIHHDEKLDLLYCGIFDGHGGAEASTWLAKELLNILGPILSGQRSPDLKQALHACFEEGDKKLMAHLAKLGGEVLSNAGSTATVVLVQKGCVAVANVGDSQAFLMRKSQAVGLSTPHRVYGSGPEVKSETSRVKATGAWIHDGRVCNILAVSRAFGDWEFKGPGLVRLLQGGVEREYWPQEFADAQKFSSDPVIVTPDVSESDIGPDDELMVVATDGLWDVLPPLEALRLAKSKFKAGKSASEVAEFLVGTALKRYTTDNVACVVLDFTGSEQWSPASVGGPGGGASWLGGLFGKQ